MSNRVHANNFVTTLNGDISSGATSIVITSATGFPTVGNGATANVTLANGSDIEIVTCTAISGTTLTVTRGAEGTTPTAFLSGSTVSIRPTADSVDRKQDKDSYETTATAAGTTTLTVNSAQDQFFTGSTTQTVVLPVVSTLALGRKFRIVNESSGNVTVQSSGANNIQVMAANTILDLECIAITGTGTASWYANYRLKDNSTGGGGGTPGGSNTQVQYNNAGAFGGITGATTDGTALTLVAPVLGTPASGVLTNCTGSGGLRSFQIFTTGTSATYTKPSNVTSILVELVGGGGGGGGCAGAASSAAVGGGGGGGGYARLWVPSASSTYTYTVGAGGSGGSAGANNGSAGGTTSFSASSLQATGGQGGGGGGAYANTTSGFTGSGGTGGVGSNGDIGLYGEPGLGGMALLGTGLSGSGGKTQYGPSGQSGFNGTGTPASPAGFGGGGAGGISQNGTDQAGANGAAGVIIVWEFS